MFNPTSLGGDLKIRQVVLAVSLLAAVCGCFAFGQPKFAIVYFVAAHVISKGVLAAIHDLADFGILILGGPEEYFLSSGPRVT